MMTAYDLTLKLNGKWHQNYGMAFCPAHNNHRTEALSLTDGANGKLLLHCFAGCTFDDIKIALEDRSLWSAGSKFAKCSEIQDISGALLKAKRAEKTWKKSKPASGTLVEKYLRKRSIDCPIPNSIRFNESCWHPSGVTLPAMVAKVEWANHFSIHRTYLNPAGRKADISTPKAILGASSGGHVALCSRSFDILTVCEGIETGLSLMSGLIEPVHTVWSCLSTSGMKHLKLPGNPTQLCIATDGDDAGRSAGLQLAERAYNLGWRVQFLHAPKGADFNDVLKNIGEIDED